jgi:hypothetical protein
MQAQAIRALAPMAWVTSSLRMEAKDERAVLKVDQVPQIVEAASQSGFWAALGEAAPAMASFIRAWLMDGDVRQFQESCGGKEVPIMTIYEQACNDYQAGRRRPAAFGFVISYCYGRVTAPASPHLPALFGLASIAAGADARDLSDRLCYWLCDQELAHPRVHLLLGLNALERDQVAEARRHLMQVAQRGRGNPKYREDQHTAQRILIGIQFGIMPNESQDG